MKMAPRLLNFTYLLCLAVYFVCAGCATISQKHEEKPEENIQEKPIESPEAVYDKEKETTPSGYYVHTVSFPNESLSIIAKWFTGDLKNWKTLAKHNQSINPNRIFLGDKIKIPRRLMTRQEPMTLEFVEKSQPRQRRAEPPPPTDAASADTTSPEVQTQPDPELVPEAEAEEEPFLFGPKDYTK